MQKSQWNAPEWGSLRYEALRDAILESPAKAKIVILDCCFSGRAVGEAMANPTTVALAQLDLDGAVVLTSASRNHVSLSPPSEAHTAFTGRLLGLLRHGLPDGDELL